MTWTPEQEAAEQARAELWRAQAQRRVQFQSWLYTSALAGDPAAGAAVWDEWYPVIAWLAERETWVEPEDDPGFDPLGISDTVNVGT